MLELLDGEEETVLRAVRWGASVRVQKLVRHPDDTPADEADVLEPLEPEPPPRPPPPPGTPSLEFVASLQAGARTEHKGKLFIEADELSVDGGPDGVTCYELSRVTSAEAGLVQVTPFLRVSRVTVRLREQQKLQFDARTGIDVARHFASNLSDAAAAAQSRAAEAAAAPAAPPDAAQPSKLKLTARVRAGRALRAELERINQLKGKGRLEEAAEAMEALEPAQPLSAEAPASSSAQPINKLAIASYKLHATSYKLQVTTGTQKGGQPRQAARARAA